MAHIFSDACGRDWSIEFDEDTCWRLRGIMGLRPVDLVPGVKVVPPADALRLLYVLVLPQAEERGVSLDEFEETLLAGDTTGPAGHATAAALWDFFNRTKLAAAEIAASN